MNDDTELRNYYLELCDPRNIMRSMQPTPLIAIAIAAGFATTSFAAPGSSVAINRHRVADCMSRQMAASRTLSYYAAQALCEEQLKAQDKTRAEDALKARNDKPATANAVSAYGR